MSPDMNALVVPEELEKMFHLKVWIIREVKSILTEHIKKIKILGLNSVSLFPVLFELFYTWSRSVEKLNLSSLKVHILLFYHVSIWGRAN